MPLHTTIMMATTNIRLIQVLGKQIRNASKQSEISFTTSSKLLSSPSSSNLPTHTGQKWDENDSRLTRFENASRQVNTRFAIDLIAQVPPKEVKSRIVSCDGGGGPLGHPKVYINLDKPGNKSCGYCGLRFVKPDDHH